MKNLFRILGVLFFVGAVILAYFCNFSGDAVVEIALASFGLASVVIATVKSQKEKKSFSWLSVVVIILAILGGVLVCLGGVASSVFATISGAVLSLIAIIIGIIVDKKTETKNE